LTSLRKDKGVITSLALKAKPSTNSEAVVPLQVMQDSEAKDGETNLKTPTPIVENSAATAAVTLYNNRDYSNTGDDESLPEGYIVYANSYFL
jgi:hypothetical protein